MSKPTKTPLRNLQRPLRLHDDALETCRRWSTFQIGRDLKIYMQLPLCALGSSIMSKATKTPLRNLQCPLRLHDDALETRRRWSTFQIGRDLKIYMQLPLCVLGSSIMSKPTKTPCTMLYNLVQGYTTLYEVVPTYTRLYILVQGFTTLYEVVPPCKRLYKVDT